MAASTKAPEQNEASVAPRRCAATSASRTACGGRSSGGRGQPDKTTMSARQSASTPYGVSIVKPWDVAMRGSSAEATFRSNFGTPDSVRSTPYTSQATDISNMFTGAKGRTTTRCTGRFEAMAEI